MLKTVFAFVFVLLTSLVAANDSIPVSIPDSLQFVKILTTFAKQVPNWSIYTGLGLVIFAGVAYVTPNKKDDNALKAMIAAFRAILGKK